MRWDSKWEMLNPGDVISLSGFLTPSEEYLSGTVYEKDRFRIAVCLSRQDVFSYPE